MDTFEDVDPFDIAEGLNVLAHDYGLYAVKTALEQRASFKASPLRDRLETIDDDGRFVYRELEALAHDTDPYTVPGWADAIISRIVMTDDDEQG